MLEAEDQPPSEISVLLTSRDGIRALNKRFRGIDEPTDVLSFPAGEGPEIEGNASLGDVAICADIAQEQAAIHGVALDVEAACLAVHGGLHLLGYDDKKAQGRNQMVTKMNDVIRSMGLLPAKDWGSHYKH